MFFSGTALEMQILTQCDNTSSEQPRISFRRGSTVHGDKLPETSFQTCLSWEVSRTWRVAHVRKQTECVERLLSSRNRELTQLVWVPLSEKGLLVLRRSRRSQDGFMRRRKFFSHRNRGAEAFTFCRWIFIYLQLLQMETQVCLYWSLILENVCSLFELCLIKQLWEETHLQVFPTFLVICIVSEPSSCYLTKVRIWQETSSLQPRVWSYARFSHPRNMLKVLCWRNDSRHSSGCLQIKHNK